MKLTSLIIQPECSWKAFGADNQMKAVVKLSSENSTVECVLSEQSMHKMLTLCADEIATQAAKNVGEFVSAASAIEEDTTKQINEVK